MKNIKRVFICIHNESNYSIIEKLMSDIAIEIKAQGIECNIGKEENYNGEDVFFNSRYLTANIKKDALVNSIFVTHIDDCIKEKELVSKLKKFNSVVCMSPHEEHFVESLVTRKGKVIGINLPPREIKIRPIRLSLFSERYNDGRKNEKWLLEYFKERKPSIRQYFCINFLGHNWESFSSDLAKLDLNYEIFRYSRSMPAEYDLYKENLSRSDYLIYLGDDGGAMSIYDAINVGIKIIAPNASYHRGLGDSLSLFNSKEDFFNIMDMITKQAINRHEGLQKRSIENYSKDLVNHWKSVLNGSFSKTLNQTNTDEDIQNNKKEILNEFRSRYKLIGLSRIRSILIRLVQNFLSK